MQLKCPVCTASFRGVETCTRCGTDLRPLMSLAARVWALRSKTREQLLTGDLATALQTAAAASRISKR